MALPDDRATRVLHWLGVLGAMFVTAGMAWALRQPGFVWSRLALAVVIIALAWAGLYAAIKNHASVTIGCGLALFFLGFWQAALWFFILPIALILVIIGAREQWGAGAP